MDQPQLFYTINECCRLAAIGRTKFYQLVASGEIPVRKVGKKTLVLAADLKRWAERLPTIKPRALRQFAPQRECAMNWTEATKAAISTEFRRSDNVDP